MCDICTEAVHGVALWTRVTLGLDMCDICTEAVHCVAIWSIERKMMNSSAPLLATWAETSSWTNGTTLKDPVFGSGKLDWSGIGFSWWFYFQVTPGLRDVARLIDYVGYVGSLMCLFIDYIEFVAWLHVFSRWIFQHFYAFVGRWVLPPWVAVSTRWAYIGPAYLCLGVFVRGWNGWNPYRVGAPSQLFLPMEWHGA